MGVLLVGERFKESFPRRRHVEGPAGGKGSSHTEPGKGRGGEPSRQKGGQRQDKRGAGVTWRALEKPGGWEAGVRPRTSRKAARTGL